MYRAATQNRPCMRSLIVDFRISKLFSFCIKWVISETSQIDSHVRCRIIILVSWTGENSGDWFSKMPHSKNLEKTL